MLSNFASLATIVGLFFAISSLYFVVYSLLFAKHELRLNRATYERSAFIDLVTSGSRGAFIAAMQNFGPVQTREVPPEPDYLSPLRLIVNGLSPLRRIVPDGWLDPLSPSMPNKEPLHRWASKHLSYGGASSCGFNYDDIFMGQDMPLLSDDIYVHLDEELTLKMFETKQLRLSLNLKKLRANKALSEREINMIEERNLGIRINLSKSDLRDADLHEVDLFNSWLSEADLKGANLNKADLGHANLREALNVTQCQLASAYWDKDTEWPDDIKVSDPLWPPCPENTRKNPCYKLIHFPKDCP